MPSPPATAPSSSEPPTQAGSTGAATAAETPVDRSVSGISVNCPGCGKALPQSGAPCTKCGLAPPDRLVCVHCGSAVDVVASKDARFVCSRCGGVRIPPAEADAARSDAQTELLKKATVARNAKQTWRVAAGVVAGFGAFSGLILAMVASVADTGTGPTLAGAASVLATWAFAAYAVKRSRAEGELLRTLLDKAWGRAAK
jgi:hypothetical protein